MQRCSYRMQCVGELVLVHSGFCIHNRCKHSILAFAQLLALSSYARLAVSTTLTVFKTRWGEKP